MNFFENLKGKADYGRKNNDGEKKEDVSVSRRNFLKGAIAGAAGLAAAGMIPDEAFAKKMPGKEISIEDQIKREIEEREERIKKLEKLKERILNEEIPMERKNGDEERCASLENMVKHYNETIDENKKAIKSLGEKLPQVHELETANAFFRIVYEAHERENPISVLNRLDGYAMEGIEVEKNLENVEKYNNHVYEGRDDNMVEAIRLSGKPLYRIDLNGDYFAEEIIKSMKRISSKDGWLHLLELISAGYVAGKPIKDLIKRLKNRKTEKKEDEESEKENSDEDGLSRRSFLKFGARSAAVILAGDLAFRQAGGEKRYLDDDSAYRKIEKKRQKFFESMGVGVILTTFRNAIMAQKLNDIAIIIRSEKGRKPYLGLEIGSAHSGIEDFLKMDENKRIKIISDIIKEMKLKIENPQNEIALIIQRRFDKSEGKWVETRSVDEKIMSIFKNS